MTANEILNEALRTLGYTDCDGNTRLPQAIRNRAAVTVNLVYEDLHNICNGTPFVPINSLDDKVTLPEKVLHSAFLYGLAMHIARSENDGDQQQFYAHLYNSKRAALSKTQKVKNTIPRGVDI